MIDMKPFYLPIAIALFCLTGCDGTYSYTYQGMLYRSDGITPASNTPFECSISSGRHPDWQTAPTTDGSGRFNGTMRVTTNIILPLPAPKLDKLYFLTPGSPPIEIGLQNTEQPTTRLGRSLAVPAIILPR